MAEFDVSILLRLVDQLTGPARKIGASYNQLSKSISQSSASIRASSSAMGSNMAAISNSAARANKQVGSFYGNVRKLGEQASRSRRGGGMFSGDNGMFKAIGGTIALRNVISAAEETAKAENKFRSLVDNVTPDQMKGIRSLLTDRMMQSGETYAELISAAGDAAQIMGSAALSKDVAVAASRLKNVDTDGKDLQFFAENLSAVVGKNGTVEQITRLGDMLAMQQKLGAATAGGTIDAYRNFSYLRNTTKFNEADALTAIGLIKNASPALQNSRIGVAGQYGIRMLSSPSGSDKKALDKAGLSTKDFETDGAFDIQKAQRIFYEMGQTTDGMKKFKEMFAGRNVQARLFWENLLGVSPEEFAKYKQALIEANGTLSEADNIRFEGIVGAMNKIRASAFRLSLAFGELLTPALLGFGWAVASIVPPFGEFTRALSQNHPVVASAVGGYLGLVATLSALGLVWGRAAGWARFIAALPLVLGRGALTGAFTGIASGAAAFVRASALAYRFAGALGAATVAFRVFRKALGVGLIIEAFSQIYENWDRIRALVQDPLKVEVIFPEAPAWLQWLMRGTAQIGKDFADIGQGTYDPNRPVGQKSLPGMIYEWMEKLLPKGMPEVDPLAIPHAFPAHAFEGIPAAVRGQVAAEGSMKAPKGITVQMNGPGVTFKQAPPRITVTNNVTVNATTNASPDAIGSAAASAVGAKVRGALSDAPHSAP